MNQPKRSTSTLPAPYRELDDVALAEAMVERDDAAWREFVHRFDPPLRRLIARTMARAMRLALDSDALDDVMGDFYLAVVENDMRKVRAWLGGARQAALVRWLGLIARGIAIDHIRLAFNHQTDRISLDDEDKAGDPTRAATFDRAAQSVTTPRLQIRDHERKRIFAWFGDEHVLVYGEEGQEVDRFPVGAGWKRKPKPSDVEAIIRRRIKQATSTAGR